MRDKGDDMRLLHPFVIALGIIATAAPGSADAQDSLSDELDEWFDIATIYNFSDRFRYDGDYGIRSLFSTRGFKQLYFRPSVRYRVKPWFLVHGGIAWFHSNYDDQDNVNELRRPLHRFLCQPEDRHPYGFTDGA